MTLERVQKRNQIGFLFRGKTNIETHVIKKEDDIRQRRGRAVVKVRCTACKPISKAASTGTSGPPMPCTLEKDELAEDARKLWVNLGGTNEGWTLWYARRATELQRLATLRWDDANEPLAAFKLADLNGKTWRCRLPEGQGNILELLGILVRNLPRGVASLAKAD